MKSKGIILILLVAMCWLIFCPLRAEANLVNIEIEALVDSVEDDFGYLEGKVNVGDIITGTYTYESTTVDSSPLDPVQGNYWHYTSPAGVSLTVGGFLFESDPSDVAFHLAIRNDIPPLGEDIYAFVSSNNLPLANETLVESITWQLYDPVGNALSSDLLPASPPILADYELRNRLSMYGIKNTFHVKAHVVSVIPEPATVLLLGPGSLLLRKQRLSKI